MKVTSIIKKLDFEEIFLFSILYIVRLPEIKKYYLNTDRFTQNLVLMVLSVLRKADTPT